MNFVTLGPEGSCHDNATKAYLLYHLIADSRITYVNNLLDGLEQVYNGQADYVVQCSAALDVHLLTEKYYNEIFVTDTFIFPTKELAILENRKVNNPQTLGLVKATEGYLDYITYPNLVYETSKPIVGMNLQAGKYDAGLTYIEYHTENPHLLRVRKYIGYVLTTWLVYGKTTSFSGSLLGVAPPDFYKS